MSIHIQMGQSDSFAPSIHGSHVRSLCLTFLAWSSAWVNHESGDDDVCSFRDHVHDLLSLRQYIRSFLLAVYSPIDQRVQLEKFMYANHYIWPE